MLLSMWLVWLLVVALIGWVIWQAKRIWELEAELDACRVAELARLAQSKGE